MDKFIDNIKKAKVISKPFDHIIVDNLLSESFYTDLSKELEGVDLLHIESQRGFDISSYGGPDRLAVDITNYSSWEGSERTIPTTLHQDHYGVILSRGLSNIQLFINSLLRGEEDFYSALHSKLVTEKFQKKYFFHISMIKDKTRYEIKPHTDDEQNIFTILFYAPETEANKQFGLNIFEEKGEVPIDTDSLGQRNLELSKRVDFIPNRMIAFAPSSEGGQRNATWHGVSSLTDELIGSRNSFQMFFYRSN